MALRLGAAGDEIPSPWMPLASIPEPEDWPLDEGMPSKRRRKFNYWREVLTLTVGVVATAAGSVLSTYLQPPGIIGFCLFSPLILAGSVGFLAAARSLAARRPMPGGLFLSAGESAAGVLCVAEFVAIQIWFGC